MADYGTLRRMPVDPKLVDKIGRSASMMSEQGEGFQARYGNPAMYKELSRMPLEERLTFAAISEGYINPSEIEVVTGMTSSEVNKGIAGLRSKRLIRNEEEVLK